MSSKSDIVQLDKLQKKDHSLDIDTELTIWGISLVHPNDHVDPKKAGRPKLWTEKKKDIKLNEEQLHGSKSNYDKRFFKKQSTAVFYILPNETRAA